MGLHRRCSACRGCAGAELSSGGVQVLSERCSVLAILGPELGNPGQRLPDPDQPGVVKGITELGKLLMLLSLRMGDDSLAKLFELVRELR